MQIYINKLIHNLPDKHYGEINLILDGGAFSGSYILGALYYIKELEKEGKITIKKLSGCSIGSILCILYELDDLDFCASVYSLIREHFKKYGNLFILNDIMTQLLNKMDNDFYKRCNNKIFLSYHDVRKNKSVVRKKYKNNNDLLETILKSSYIPLICGKRLLYKNRFLDGLMPHVFQDEKSLFINLCMDYKYIMGMLNIKNEVNNIERVMNGILDIHAFLLNEYPGNMCYYINDITSPKINYSQKILHIIRLIIIQIIVGSSYLIYHGYNSIKDHPSFVKYYYFVDISRIYIQKFIYAYLRYFMV